MTLSITTLSITIRNTPPSIIIFDADYCNVDCWIFVRVLCVILAKCRHDECRGARLTTVEKKLVTFSSSFQTVVCSVLICHSVCQPICPSPVPSVYLSPCHSICLSICLYFHSSVYLNVSMSLNNSVRLIVCRCICLSIHSYIHPSTCISLCLGCP